MDTANQAWLQNGVLLLRTCARHGLQDLPRTGAVSGEEECAEYGDGEAAWGNNGEGD